MGMFSLNFSAASCDPSQLGRPLTRIVYRDAPTPPLPRADRWEVIQQHTIGEMLILEVQYTDCINYEGRKLMVFEQGVTLHDIAHQGDLDPHFCECDKIHPIARFEPTPRGWQLATALAWTLA